MNEEIHDHSLCKTIKTDHEFVVKEGEVNRIDRIMKAASEWHRPSRCGSCLGLFLYDKKKLRIDKKGEAKLKKHLDVRSLDQLHTSYNLLVKRILTKRQRTLLRY